MYETLKNLIFLKLVIKTLPRDLIGSSGKSTHNRRIFAWEKKFEKMAHPEHLRGGGSTCVERSVSKKWMQS